MSIKSQIEIERKYLLANIPQDIKKQSAERIVITQFFEGDIKYRMSTYMVEGKRVCERIVKKHIGGITNSEDIEEISYEVYEEVFNSIKKIPIIKHRFVIYSGDLKLEIDVFLNIKLIICEVEIAHTGYQVKLPDFILNEIIKEVSEDRFFSNKNLFEILNKN